MSKYYWRHSTECNRDALHPSHSVSERSRSRHAITLVTYRLGFGSPTWAHNRLFCRCCIILYLISCGLKINKTNIIVAFAVGAMHYIGSIRHKIIWDNQKLSTYERPQHHRYMWNESGELKAWFGIFEMSRSKAALSVPSTIKQKEFAVPWSTSEDYIVKK